MIGRLFSRIGCRLVHSLTTFSSQRQSRVWEKSKSDGQSRLVDASRVEIGTWVGRVDAAI